MDGQRFDDLTRLLAKGASRRQVMRGLAGGTLGGAFVALGFKGPGVRAVAAAQDCRLGDDSTCGDGKECCPVHGASGQTVCIPKGTNCAQGACAGDGDPCVYASECCTAGASCTGNVCTPPAPPAQCTLGDDSTCGANEECCPVHNQAGQTTCIPTGTNCAQQACANDGSACLYASECCTDGASCTGNVCTPPAHQCVEPGGECQTVQDCCVGQCSSAGACNCGHPDAPWQDCPCDPNTSGSCGTGFVCCAGGDNNQGGTCVPEAQGCQQQCKEAGQQCSSGSDCCSGKCSDQGVCYCTDPSQPGVGCACTTGTENPCGDATLVCCATTNQPGGPGVCAPASTGCQGPCKGAGDKCSANGDCCSGKCSQDGICYCTDPARPGLGCACTTGTENACGDANLVCCANTPGAPAGSPGTCTSASVGCQQPVCKDAGDTCSSDSDCCQGKCDPQQKICYCSDPDRPFVGCTCKSGDNNACSGHPNLCCNGTCISPMASCPPTCQGAGDTCKQDSDCCQGKCSDKGICYCKDPGRPAVGCTCTTGTENPCSDKNLLCCATTSQPGGPGICTPSSIGCQPQQCQGAGDHCRHGGDCCSGKCSKHGICYCSDPTRPALGCACTTGTQNPCGDANLICCSTSNVPGGPGVCTSASVGCQPVTSLPNTGSGLGGGRKSDWETTAAVVGAGAAALLGWWRRTTGRAADAEATEEIGTE